MREVFLIAACGALGATSRYGVGVLMQRLLGEGFVFGTLAVNLTGCLLLGFVYHTAQVREIFSTQFSAALGIGFLGALTTFSTFGLETFLCLEQRRYALAGSSVAINLVGGLLLVWAGISLSRAIIGQ